MLICFVAKGRDMGKFKNKQISIEYRIRKDYLYQVSIKDLAQK